MNREQEKEINDIIDKAKFRVDQGFPIEMRLHGLVDHFNALVGLIERNEKDAQEKDLLILDLEDQIRARAEGDAGASL